VCLPAVAISRGLGAGVSADAFVRHGISTTIVEIDPAVYDAARKYFGLGYPGDDHVFLEDARRWVYKRRAAMQSDDQKCLSTFDFIIHDCFSGGGVPQHLFSVEFWNDLKSIMKPHGVVAVVRQTRGTSPLPFDLTCWNRTLQASLAQNRLER